MAQEAPGATGGVVTYDQTFFARFEANNAEDLLRRIPGVPAILDAEGGGGGAGGGGRGGQQERGFGSGGSQFLLNGSRFPGKSNQVTTNLRRIPASNVERVELISSGAASGITVQSQGIIVNLVLREGASIGGSGSWEVNGRFNDQGWADVDGLVSYTRSFGGLTVGGGVERNVISPQQFGVVRWTDKTRDEVYYYPGGAIQELRPQEYNRRHYKWVFTGNADYEFANGDDISINGLFEKRKVNQYDYTPLTRFSPAGAETLRALEVHQRANFPAVEQLEIGGEYTAGLGPGTWRTIVLVRRAKEPTIDIRNRDETVRVVEVSRSDSRVRTSEDILRSSYVLPLGADKSLELGAEGARNTLKQHLDVFFDSDRDGKLEPAYIPIDDPIVKELRGEAFAVYKWQILPPLSLDASLNYEYSKLTTNYPFQPERTLGFLKPRIDMRYRVAQPTQLRLLVERTVSQLDFANFVPSYNVTDDRVEAGNPALEPEKTWTYEVGVEHRLARDGGLIDVRAFYKDITDAIDKVPLFDDRGVLVSAEGNIPKAKLYGAEARISLRLRFIGLPDAQLNLRGLRQWSSIKDPFRNFDRKLSDDRSYSYDIGFRHDLTKLKMSYGFNYKSYGLHSTSTDLLFTQYFSLSPTLDAFVERSLWGNVTLRFEVENILAGERRWRELYAVNAMDGRLRRVDFYEETRDVRAALRLRGTF